MAKSPSNHYLFMMQCYFLEWGRSRLSTNIVAITYWCNSNCEWDAVDINISSMRNNTPPGVSEPSQSTATHAETVKWTTEVAAAVACSIGTQKKSICSHIRTMMITATTHRHTHTCTLFSSAFHNSYAFAQHKHVVPVSTLILNVCECVCMCVH